MMIQSLRIIFLKMDYYYIGCFQKHPLMEITGDKNLQK